MKKTNLFILALSLFCVQFSQGSIKQSQYPSVNDSVKIIEKVYIHSDRDIYFAGDDIWFKAYLIDALDRTLTENSSNLHVELISPSSKIISTRIIQLAGGLGKGDFKLSVDVRSGRYKIRAYTNYMRNFSDQLFFCKDITVINSTDSSQVSDQVKYVENKLYVSFFPEGGSLVDNVSSVVAFKAENYLGKGCDVSGKIYSSAGELVTTFKSTHLGMGKFFLRPLPGLKYYSIVRGSDSSDVRTELTKSFPAGVTFSASVNENNELLIITKTNPETLTIVSDSELFLNISIRREVIKTIPFRIKSTVTSFVVPTDDLPDGIVMLTLASLHDLPLAERLVYLEREAPEKIKIETDKLIYSKREPVALRISLPGDSLSENKGNVSVAVVDENLMDNTVQFPGNISSWFLLESDVHGYVEDPSYYFDFSNSDRLKDLDLLLRTQGWRDFAWKYDTAYFPPESGFTISGRLRKRTKDKPIEESRVSIGIFGNTSTFLTTLPVDSSGRFRLPEIDLKGEARLIVTGLSKKDRLQGLIIVDSVSYVPAKVPENQSQVMVLAENNWSRLKTYYEISESIKKKYKLSDTINLGEVRIVSQKPKDMQAQKVERSRSKYGKPDSELLITQDMYSYPNLAEAMRGKIPGVEIVSSSTSSVGGVSGMSQNYKIRIRGSGTIYGTTAPLILVDGIKTSMDDLITIPVNFIERIDVLKTIGSSSIFGIDGASGVINLITRAGGPGYIPVNYSKNIRINGFHTPRIFYSPQHPPDSKSEYNPDFRSTLYWNPDINLDGNKVVNLNYYNCDNASVTRITVEGITTEGIPVTGRSEYEVR
jgi:hypothetical protein